MQAEILIASSQRQNGHHRFGEQVDLLWSRKGFDQAEGKRPGNREEKHGKRAPSEGVWGQQWLADQAEYFPT